MSRSRILARNKYCGGEWPEAAVGVQAVSTRRSVVPLFRYFLCFLCLTHLVSLSCYDMYLAYLVCTENIETFHSFALP